MRCRDAWIIGRFASFLAREVGTEQGQKNRYFYMHMSLLLAWKVIQCRPKLIKKDLLIYFPAERKQAHFFGDNFI
jgi:hypothetical protein